MSVRRIVVVAALGVVGVSLSPVADATDDGRRPCASPTATPEDLGPSMTARDEALGYVCRENGEVAGAGD